MPRKYTEQPRPSIIIDTREQLPFDFPGAITRTLRTGDYSLDGLEDKICVERKSKADLFGSLGHGRARVEREFQRMAGFDYAAIVIEANLSDLLTPPPFSRMSPRVIINTLVSWSIKYKVHVYFAGCRRNAGALILRILEKYWGHTTASD